MNQYRREQGGGKYHIHGCKECKKAVMKPGPWAVCKRTENYDKCDNHRDSCWHSPGEYPARGTSTAADHLPLLPSPDGNTSTAGMSSVSSVEGRGGNRMSYKVTDPIGVCMWGQCQIKGTRCLPDGYCSHHCDDQHSEYKAGVCDKGAGAKDLGKFEPQLATLVAEETF